MKWESDPVKDSLLILLISLLILAFAGFLVGTEIISSPPEDISGKFAVGFVSLCMDDPPQIILGNISCRSREECYYDLKENTTNSPHFDTFPIYFYNVPSDIFSVGWDTGIINFTPKTDDEGNYSMTFCVTHNLCEGVEDCEQINFEIYGNSPPNWTEIPNFYAFETKIGYAEICTEDNSSCEYNISLHDYVTDLDDDPLVFGAILFNGSFSQDFPSFTLNPNTGIIVINNSDNIDVGVHTLFVWANDGFGRVYANPFTFEIINVEEAPIWTHNISHQYLCENELFSYRLDNISYDPDPGDQIILYYMLPSWSAVWFSNTHLFVLPYKQDVGDHIDMQILAMDTTGLISGITTNFTVIEINNPPYFHTYTFIEGNESPVTKYLKSPLPPGNASPPQNYYLKVNAFDEEDGDNLTFSVSFSDRELFEINSSTGEINFTPSLEDGGEHFITICFRDQGLPEIHLNASLCEETGDTIEVCYNTSIFIGNNTPPEIINWTPYNLSVEIREGSSRAFTIEYDDFEKTALSVLWILNSEIVREEIVYPVNDTYPKKTYVYSPGYFQVGEHTLKAMVYDGEFNDTVVWNITVLEVPRPDPVSGGSGAVGGRVCDELWRCSHWSICQNLTDSVTYPIRGNILDKCRRENVPEGYCGYQIRECIDINKCGTKYNKPIEIQGCYYSPRPSCYDGIRNCHSGSCEILVDCGGPCDPCPTCSDGIQNQGEEGIDCGGPCPPCEIVYPLIPKCGDRICNFDEILTCPSDCWVVWMTILVMLITLVIFKKGADKIYGLKTKKLRKERSKQIHIIIKNIDKAIESKDIAFAKKLYKKAEKIFSELSEEEKLEAYAKLTDSLEEIKKYEK